MPLENPGRKKGNPSPRSSSGRLTLLVLVAIALITLPASAEPWYEHYSKAEKALENQNWSLAVQELIEALEKRGDSGERVRTYGMKVTSYFPYLKLGIAYYHLGQLDAALQAFETEERLGAIARSNVDSGELERFRDLVQQASEAAAAEAVKRVRDIVQQSLAEAKDLENDGRLDAAIAVLDRALAVAPDDTAGQAAMSRLRQQVARREQDQELDQRVSELLEEGEARLRLGQYSKASSFFRQALSLKPSSKVQELLNDAQAKLFDQLEATREFEDRQNAIAEKLQEVQSLESAGRLVAALDRLQSILALDPSNREAQSIQERLLRIRKEAEDERTRQEAVDGLLAEAGSRFLAGSAEESLSAANRALALDPGNAAALQHVARAYRRISQQLLGTGASQNIPPAVRFVDLRQEGDDGSLVQTTRRPDFRLNGVVIDDMPVEIVFYDSNQSVLEITLNDQPLGQYHITEFNLESQLPPGLSTFRLVATDSEDLSSSSEYSVFYARPFFRASWFYALLLVSGVVTSSTLVWQRSRRRERLRKRRFNPYVAGAPVLDDRMFFGRRELVDRILETIHNNSLLLYGERRIGKTSIQHQLRKRLSQLDDPTYDFYPVYIDLQGTPEARFFSTMAEDIFQDLAPELGSLSPAKDTTEDYSYRDFVRDVHAVLKALKKQSSKKVKLVLLIDEVDELNDYDPRINQKLRSLFMKSFAENLISVVSGVEIKKQWEREGSPWYNFFEEIEVKPLGRDEARELVERPIRGIFKLDDGVTDRIISLTDAKPYLIQKLCISLVTRLHEQQRRRITMEDVEAVGRPVEA